jgi:hypothetical protein
MKEFTLKNSLQGMATKADAEESLDRSKMEREILKDFVPPSEKKDKKQDQSFSSEVQSQLEKKGATRPKVEFQIKLIEEKKEKETGEERLNRLKKRTKLSIMIPRTTRNAGRSKFLAKKRMSMSALIGKNSMQKHNLLKRRKSLVVPRRPSGLEQITEQITTHTKQNKQLDKEKKEKMFNIGNRDIENYITNVQTPQTFQQVWAFIVFLANTYNFLVFFFFLGIPGTPAKLTLVFEIAFEFFLFIDFFLRIFFSQCFNQVWESLWLLQEPKGSKLPFIILKALASFPQHFLLLLLKTPQATLISLPIALVRGLKLCRIYQIKLYFSKEILAFKRRNFTFLKTIQVVYSLILAANLIGAAWLIIYRIEPRGKGIETWYSAANMDKASDTEKYLDAVFYVVATMTGLGYGDVIPITSAERLVCICVMFTGATIFADFFARFAVSIYHNNQKGIENRQRLEQAKGFANQRNLPAEFKNKIRNYYSFIRLKYGKLEQRYEILHELPLSLRTELALFINVDLIQKVKLFQLSDPSFIMAITRFFI